MGDTALFETITRLDTLEAAWEKVKANGGGAGGDGMTLDEFEIDLPTRLVRLQVALRSGAYRPGRLRRVDVPKDDGGVRPLAIPPVVDRVAQTAAALVLTPLLDDEMEDASFAYRPGRSVQRAVARVAEHRRNGYSWVVDGDIERYFERVPHDRLHDRVVRSIPDTELCALIDLWLEAFSEDGLGLPQGAPLSPLLANLYLDDIDERIAGRGVRLVRFADDFLLMCRSEMAAESARERMAALLAEHGLRLHPDKTRIVTFEQGFRFLGHLFVRSLVVKEVETGEEAALAPDEALLLTTPPPPASFDDAEDDRRRHPGLRVLYVLEPGRSLSLRNQAFTVVEDGVELIAIPPQRVDRIELGPRAGFSPEAVRHALAHGVAVALLDGNGSTTGTLTPPASAHAALHLAQARHALDPEARLDLARRLVDGRLRNQRAQLRRLNRARKRPEVVVAVTTLTGCLRRLPVAGDVAAVMGQEGAAAAAYWPALGQCLEHSWSLRQRRRRPPPDPVNLVLSFLSALLHRDIGALMLRHGLHPGFGALHTARDGGVACVSDLIEEFRAPLVEALTVYLFNNRVLRPEMFETRPDGRCKIHPAGREALVRGYEHWLDRPVRRAPGEDRMLWRRLVEAQVVAYKRHILEEDPYKPYRMDY